jgi:hypothetical protein
MEQGDVLLLTDGRMLQIVQMGDKKYDLACVQYIDQSEHSFVQLYELDVAHNLGQGPSVLSHFFGLNSLHVRFNNLAKV